MGRIYSVTYNGTLTNAGGDTDIFSIQPASNKPVRVRGFRLGQTSETGDTAEENVRITVKRLPATFTVGSGGSSVTAKAPQGSTVDAVWGATVRTNDTTVATSSGTVDILDEFAWNIRGSPYTEWYPDREYCPGAFNGQGLVLRLESTVIDDVTFSGVLFFEEDG